MLTINDDKPALQKHIEELTEKNKQESYIIKGKLSDKEKEIELLRERDSTNADAIANLSDQLMKLAAEVHKMKKQN